MIVSVDPYVTRLDLIHDDAVALDCVEEVQHVRTILAQGTSAHRRVMVHQEALAADRFTLIAVEIPRRAYDGLF